VALFVWKKPVLTFYRDNRLHPEREPFVVVQATKLSINLLDNKTIEGKIEDFFALMGDLDYITTKDEENKRFIVCWFDDKENDFNKAARRLLGVTFKQETKFEADDRGKRTYNADFSAEFGKLE